MPPPAPFAPLALQPAPLRRTARSPVGPGPASGRERVAELPRAGPGGGFRSERKGS
ncbi:hypothetical protein [Streptomyces sp. DH8]|uniref:hypothetical protein n=1 Tax=Streptomyces sp. DH8 TaxID=2857008 RepID=UPI001E413C73|nr:hypothetical protein [Streptomyces sp. DH8]